MSHISDEARTLPSPDLPFKLRGSAAKTAFSLRQNLEAMIREGGLNSTGFLTLTVGDEGESGFDVVFATDEASRRINNANRRLLREVFEKWVVVTERCKSRAVHFHIVGIIKGRPDIRTGFDFDAVRNGNYSSASATLRGLWKLLRDRLPDLGFGRAQLTPIEKSGEAIAGYVSKYVEKHLFNREGMDRRKKLVRYCGFDRHVRPNDFGWATPGATRWRLKARCVAAVAAGVDDPAQASECLGPRWALRITELFPLVTVDQFSFIDGDYLRELWQRAERMNGAKMARLAERYFDALECWRELDEEKTLEAETARRMEKHSEQFCLTL